MKTAKEFIEKLQSDEAFAAQIREKAVAAEDKFAAVSAAAKEAGYDISPEQIKEITQTQMEDLSEEELGKIAGGSTPACAWSLLVCFESVTFLSYAIID